MNELEYYLERYFKELQPQETPAVKEMGFSESATRRTRERQEVHYADCDSQTVYRRLKRTECQKGVASAGI